MKASEYRDSGGGASIEKAGVYRLMPAYIDTEAKTKNGDPMLKVCWEDKNGNGSVWDNLPVIDTAGFKWGRLWFALGEEDRDFPAIQDLANACIRKLNAQIDVYAKVIIETYKGNPMPRIESYLSPEEGEATMKAMSRTAPRDTDEEPPF